MRWKRQLTYSVTGLNLDNPLSASNVIKEWEGRLDEEEYVESGVDDDVRPSFSISVTHRGTADAAANPPYPIYSIPPCPSALPASPTSISSTPSNDPQTLY
jgi:hypothetical protein